MSSHQIFISYSRRNTELVDRLMSDLGSDFELWRDTQNLELGTPSWERSIREAIEACKVVVLCASPDVPLSDYVIGELNLARRNNRQVYPAWLLGDEWVDCVPLNMSNHQYSDCRDTRYSNGVTELKATLHNVLNSENTIRLSLPTHETIDFSIDQFDSGFSLANHVYLNFLDEFS